MTVLSEKERDYLKALERGDDEYIQATFDDNYQSKIRSRVSKRVRTEAPKELINELEDWMLVAKLVETGELDIPKKDVIRNLRYEKTISNFIRSWVIEEDPKRLLKHLIEDEPNKTLGQKWPRINEVISSFNNYLDALRFENNLDYENSRLAVVKELSALSSMLKGAHFFIHDEVDEEKRQFVNSAMEISQKALDSFEKLKANNAYYIVLKTRPLYVKSIDKTLRAEYRINLPIYILESHMDQGPPFTAGYRNWEEAIDGLIEWLKKEYIVYVMKDGEIILHSFYFNPFIDDRLEKYFGKPITGPIRVMEFTRQLEKFKQPRKAGGIKPRLMKALRDMKDMGLFDPNKVDLTITSDGKALLRMMERERDEIFLSGGWRWYTDDGNMEG